MPMSLCRHNEMITTIGEAFLVDTKVVTAATETTMIRTTMTTMTA